MSKLASAPSTTPDLQARHEIWRPQPDVRANLVAAQLAGLGLARYILHFEPLASAAPEQVVRWVGRPLQRYLTASL